MASIKGTPLWTTGGPANWPEAPDEMTVSTLAELEACPRRWALTMAEYPSIWCGRGYPPRLRPNALAGTVVHLVLETITRALVHAACFSVQDTKAPQVMKTLGGYTKVIQDCIDRVIERLSNNPRTAQLVDDVARTLRAQMSELRTRTQTILCRLRLPCNAVVTADAGSHARRSPLSYGAYPEIELRARRIGWKGRVDLLVLTDKSCEISDFKTGARDDEHQFQIQVYALLWSADEELNPGQRHADRLVLRYSGVDVEVPVLTAGQLDGLERDLVARRDAANRSVSMRPPEARPAPQNCRLCGVRQLCSEYWKPAAQQTLATEGADRRFSDVEMTITGRHGPSSWDAVIGVSRDAPEGKQAVLRTKDDLDLRSGVRLRVLDAAVVVDVEDETQPAVVTLGTLSEMYAVS